MILDGQHALNQKFADLLAYLRQKEQAVLAFSGGVDSSFLLKAMHLSGMKAVAVTGISETMPRKDLLDATAFARETGIEHIVIHTGELANELFASNPPDRCFYCKDELFGKIRAIAAERNCPILFDGCNHDDLNDFRPGRRAAALHGVLSPLAELGFSKDDIRSLAKETGLILWNKPSSPCLSSRFPYGKRITREALDMVAAAEDFLKTFGLCDIRVRHEGDTARIEVNEGDMHLLMNEKSRRLIVDTLKRLGFAFVALDLEGFRSGALNRVLKSNESLSSPHDSQ